MDFRKYCARDDCNKSFDDHEHGRKRASRAGWFHQQNGNSWCPNHIPKWVAKWRETKI